MDSKITSHIIKGAILSGISIVISILVYIFNLYEKQMNNIFICNDLIEVSKTICCKQQHHDNFVDTYKQNFDYYEKNNPSNVSLKKFLDFQRYTKAKMYKMEGNSAKFHQLKKGISLSNLNWKQIILLYLPSFWLHQIKSWKLNKLKKGKRFTSYN